MVNITYIINLNIIKVIKFKNINQEVPYLLFKNAYNKALNAGQKTLKLYQYHLSIKKVVRLIQDM